MHNISYPSSPTGEINVYTYPLFVLQYLLQLYVLFTTEFTHYYKVLHFSFLTLIRGGGAVMVWSLTARLSSWPEGC